VQRGGDVARQWVVRRGHVTQHEPTSAAITTTTSRSGGAVGCVGRCAHGVGNEEHCAGFWVRSIKVTRSFPRRRGRGLRRRRCLGRGGVECQEDLKRRSHFTLRSSNRLHCSTFREPDSQGALQEHLCSQLRDTAAARRRVLDTNAIFSGSFLRQGCFHVEKLVRCQRRPMSILHKCGACRLSQHHQGRSRLSSSSFQRSIFRRCRTAAFSSVPACRRDIHGNGDERL